VDGKGLKLKHGHGKVRQIVIPDDQEVAASKVVMVAKEIGAAELRLGEQPFATPLKDVVREGRPALNDSVTEAGGLLGEELTHTDLQLRNEAERGNRFTVNESHQSSSPNRRARKLSCCRARKSSIIRSNAARMTSLRVSFLPQRTSVS